MDILQTIRPEGLKVIEIITGGLVTSFEFNYGEQPYYLELTEREVRDGITENAARRYHVRDYIDGHNEHCSEVIDEWPEIGSLYTDELNAFLYSYAGRWEKIKE